MFIIIILIKSNVNVEYYHNIWIIWLSFEFIMYERQSIYHDVTHSEAIHSEIISFVAYGDDFNDSDNVL